MSLYPRPLGNPGTSRRPKSTVGIGKCHSFWCVPLHCVGHHTEWGRWKNAPSQLVVARTWKFSKILLATWSLCSGGRGARVVPKFKRRPLMGCQTLGSDPLRQCLRLGGEPVGGSPSQLAVLPASWWFSEPVGGCVDLKIFQVDHRPRGWSLTVGVTP